MSRLLTFAMVGGVGFIVDTLIFYGFISMGWGRINDGSRAGILRCCDHNMVGQSMFDVFAINKG